MLASKIFVPTLFALGGYSRVADLKARDDNLKFYAYGDGMGGYEVVYIDELAYITTDTSVSGAHEFTFEATIGVATTEITATVDGVEGSPVFYTPAERGQAGFSTSPTDSQTTVFTFYGATLLTDGVLLAESTDTDGLWKLIWSPNVEEGTTVGLRTAAPSTGDV